MMDHQRFVRALMLVACLAVAMPACTPPDQWEVFEDAIDERVREAPPRPIEVPDYVQPETRQKVSLAIPPDGGPIPLSIEEAVLLSLERNRDLQVQQLNPVITGTFEQIERGVFDPEVFAEADFLEESASETARSTGQQFNVEGRDTAAIGGIRQRLPTGTDIEATVGQDRTISNRAPEQQTARLGLTVTQSLLRGFGPAVNLASIRQAELDTVASIYELRGFTEALLAETEIAYWNFVLAKEEIAIFQRSLTIAEQQRDEVEQRIEVGVLPETEAAAARAEVALRRQALIDARSLLEERRLRLVRLINPGPAGELDYPVEATTNPRLKPVEITNAEERLQLAEQKRPDLKEARIRLDQNRIETIVTRNGLLPRLDVFIGLGQTGYADAFSRSFREINGDTYDFSAGVGFSHFLGNRTAEARDYAARASRRQAAEAVGNLRQLVRLDVRLALNELERARQQIAATAATRALQERTLEAEQERFDVGASTALLVAQAQRDLLEADIAEMEAIVAYRIALVNLYLAEGTLLERRGIAIAPGAMRNAAMD